MTRQPRAGVSGGRYWVALWRLRWSPCLVVHLCRIPLIRLSGTTALLISSLERTSRGKWCPASFSWVNIASSDQGVSQKNPGEGKEFPKLAAIPQRPANTSNQGLVADVEGRKYAQSIARQGEAAPVAVAKTAPPAPAAPMQPAPPAMPAVKVTQAPAPAPEPVMKTPQPAPQVATTPEGQPANTMSPLDADPYATVIVSSNGIEVNGSTVAMPERQQTALASGSSTPALKRFKTPASGAKIATILFDNGSDNLDTHDRKILGEVVRLQKQRGGMVRVIGHSSSRTRDMDAVRHAMVNYKLSTDRANTIAAALVRQGMPSEVLMVDARSDTMPMYSESMPAGEAGNRRAEVYFVN